MYVGQSIEGLSTTIYCTREMLSALTYYRRRAAASGILSHADFLIQRDSLRSGVYTYSMRMLGIYIYLATFAPDSGSEAAYMALLDVGMCVCVCVTITHRALNNRLSVLGKRSKKRIHPGRVGWREFCRHWSLWRLMWRGKASYARVFLSGLSPGLPYPVGSANGE
ncbi:hypothetical protein P280DRAFT_32458 [Massarina eburnea CBS 473.64]|uniref:Uncharacterized protein n=1 Tax=Massarina eburnea CBS 473.64 TaxID=1395130 RepID=A0A6A6S0V0_9PLEO|nr:hypothetical protein P280DRAFT_32458 [Massarina eburnea CBS 473.64]